MPEIRLRRQVRLVFRKTSERSHTTAAFLATVEGEKIVRIVRSFERSVVGTFTRSKDSKPTP